MERHIARHVKTFTRKLEYDLTGRELAMTDCWVNIMPRHVVHGLHLHPLSTLSGTYYVRHRAGVPVSSSKIRGSTDSWRLRLASPTPRTAPGWCCRRKRAALVLFESWLRHEVAANPLEAERISISFNYGWF